MRFAAYDALSPGTPIAAIPITIEQSSSRWLAAVMLVPLALMLLAMAVPFALIAAEQPARAMLLERPVAMLQMIFGLMIWVGLFAWPANRLLAKLACRRSVSIEPGRISVVETTLFGTSSWSQPLSAFDGLAHHVRASLSGVRHELILAHPDRSRSVLLAIADRINQAEVERLARLLGVREIPARDLYARPMRPMRPIAPVDMAVGRLAPATS